MVASVMDVMGCVGVTLLDLDNMIVESEHCTGLN